MTTKKEINYRFLIFGFLFIMFFIALGFYNHYNSNKENYKKTINFVVHKKKEYNSGTKLDFFDKNDNKIDLRFIFHNDRKIFTDDSLVKNPNSFMLYVYRKEDYYSNIYFKVDSIDIEK